MSIQTFSQIQTAIEKQKINKDAATYAAMIDAIVYAVECMYEAQAWRLWLDEENRKAFLHSAAGNVDVAMSTGRQLPQDTELAWFRYYSNYIPTVQVFRDYTARVHAAFIDLLDQVHTVMASLGHKATMAGKIISYQRMHRMLDSIRDIQRSKDLGQAWLDAALKYSKISPDDYAREREALEAFYALLLSELQLKSASQLPRKTQGLVKFGLFKQADVFALHVEDFYNRAQLRRLQKHTPDQNFGLPGLRPRLEPVAFATKSFDADSVILDRHADTGQSRLPLSARPIPFVGVMHEAGALHYYKLDNPLDDEAKLLALKPSKDEQIVLHVANDWSRLSALHKVLVAQEICLDNVVVVWKDAFVALKELSTLTNTTPQQPAFVS